MSIQNISSSVINRKSRISNCSQQTLQDTSFSNIFDHAVSNLSGGSAVTLPPISKQELIQIVNTVQAQMNARLIRAMSDESREDTSFSLPLAPGICSPAVSEPSKPDPVKQIHDDQDWYNHLESIIQEAASDYEVDPALIKSIIKVESNFKSNSTSPKGAMGLMQLMPGTARDLGVKNTYDPVENIRAGTRYLSRLLNRYDGNVTMALAAYNWGMGNLEKRPAQMPLETKNYIENVTRHYKRFKT